MKRSFETALILVLSRHPA